MAQESPVYLFVKGVGLIAIMVFGIVYIFSPEAKTERPAMSEKAEVKPPVAPPCNQAEATASIEKAQAGGAIVGVSMYQNKPTVFMEANVWAGLDLTTRLGIVATLQCAVAGPDKVLTTIQILDQGGRVLAVWDGLRRNFDVK